MEPNSRKYKNRILAALPKGEITRLAVHLVPVDLKQDDTLLGVKATDGYFVEEGMASAVVSLGNGNTVEVGVIGFDGVVGIPILLGTGSSPGRTFVQIAGCGYRIKASALKDAFESGGELRNRLQMYMQGFLVQTSQTAACNRLHGIEERLARWLLTCRDRTETDRLSLTHEFLGHMLGAPRTTVTLAAGILHRAGLIDYARGQVMVRDRAGLQKTACECYATVRDEYRRLSLL
jgi:CRP-like cAMP-binding protein